MRRDGWVSLDAGDHTETMVTKVFECVPDDTKSAGYSLYINLHVRDGGFLKVSVLDEHGAIWRSPRVLSGDNCQTIRKDSIWNQVGWEGENNFRELGIVGQVIRLRFDVLNASLYSFGFYEYYGTEKPPY